MKVPTIASLTLLLAAPLHAQDSELTEFLDAVARSGERFESVDVAIAEGYRKLGPDFPGMGEHWIHPSLVMRSVIDPRRPPVIAYTDVDGERRLVGFAYTQILGPDEDVADSPFPEHAWHDHTGGVDEESLLLAGPASMHGGEEGFRVAMVHLWLGVENPDGVLAQNNWALPFYRAGVEPPSVLSAEAARAMSLGGVGPAFYEQLLRDGIEFRGETLQVAMAELARATRDVHLLRDAGRPGSEELERVWRELWEGLARSLSPEDFARLGVLGG